MPGKHIIRLAADDMCSGLYSVGENVVIGAFKAVPCPVKQHSVANIRLGSDAQEVHGDKIHAAEIAQIAACRGIHGAEDVVITRLIGSDTGIIDVVDVVGTAFQMMYCHGLVANLKADAVR